MMAGSGITQSIYERVVKSADGMTRQELKASLSLTPDQVRCRTNDLVRAGKLEVKNDDLGVPRYYAKEEKMEEKVVEPSTTEKAWDHLIQEAQQRGFAQGYAAGAEASQRAAYNQGKSDTIRRLTELLS
jgi:flagellar biosynthesis/type III secretory pathway protein FliH